MKAYRVKNWSRIFESHESRKYKRLDWIRLPTTMTGKGFKRVALHADNAKIFCAFILILEVAAVMPQRGTLIDTAGLPLDPTDLALMTGYAETIFGQAIEVLLDPKIGWLEHVDLEDRRANEPVADPPVCRKTPGESPGMPEDGGRERERAGDRRVLGLGLRKGVRSLETSTVKNAGAKNGVPSPEERDFMDSLAGTVGSKAMINWGGKWRLRYRERPEKAWRVLRDLQDKIKTGAIDTNDPKYNPGGYMHTLWKVFL